jgi:hypothetical protein
MEEIWNMEEGNQQDSLLGGNREVGDPPEGRVKFEGIPGRRPQKQGAILDVMTNPKITLGLTRGR